MSQNEQHIRTAIERMRSFEADLEADRLQKAAEALDDVVLSAESDAAKRKALRRQVLSSWMRVVALLDAHLDADFDPNDVPAKSVMPPELDDGSQLRPGAPPEAIPDAEKRAAYEKEIADHRVRVRRYRLQLQLSRFAERLPARAQAFIRGAYAASPDDRAEVTAAIEAEIARDERREALLSSIPKA